MKRGLKIVGIVILVIVVLIVLVVGFSQIKNYIHSQKPWLDEDYYTQFHSDSPLEKKYAGLGGYEVSNKVIKSEDKAIGNIRIWYPTELESKTEKYPVVFVTNGSNTAALNYEPCFERLASWGFIVVGNDDRQTGTGESASKMLDYMLEQNDNSESIFYRKVDEENIGITGYSQGGAGALRAVTEYDNSNQYKTIFTGSASYPLLAKNMGWEYDMTKVHIPYFMTAGTGTSDDRGIEDINAEFGGVAPLVSLIENYDTMASDVFKVRARVAGAEHEEILMKTDGYMTAWMLYQLRGDEEAGKVFIGEDAEILSNSNWQDIEKSR